MNKLVTTVEKQLNEHYVLDRVEDVVRSKFKEDKEEEEELNKRKASIIVHGLKESMDSETDVRKTSDESNIINMLHAIKCDDISVLNAIRLGQRDVTANKPHPLNIVVSSEQQKINILQKAKNLEVEQGQRMGKSFHASGSHSKTDERATETGPGDEK